MTVRCSCPYNLGDICRHEAAALIRLQDMVDKNMLGNTSIHYNQRHTVAKMKHIDLKMIKLLSSPGIYTEAENILRSTRANILKAADERVEAELIIEAKLFHWSSRRTTNVILILPANAARPNTRFVNTKHFCSYSCWMRMVPIISTAYVTGIKKRTNCWPSMATAE